jgi:hypothetical protein
MKFPSRNAQSGYLMEVPILLAVVGIVVSILLPMLPPVGQKILFGLAALPILFGLYYMIVIPGWTPNSSGRLRPPWSFIAFALAAALVIAVVLGFILGGT